MIEDLDKSIYSELFYFFNESKKIKDFSPNKSSNIFFTNLVKYCIDNNYEVLDCDIKTHLNNVCSLGEFELEKYYSKKIINSLDPKSEIYKFVYYDNYEWLVNFEYETLSLYEQNIKNVLFIWWWPLPLTSIIFAKKYWIKSKIIDIDYDAVNLSRIIIEKLWLSDYIKIELSDAKTYTDSEHYDLCYVAWLVFNSDSHDVILDNISNLNFKILLTRTSHKTRELLYKKVNINILEKYFNPFLIKHPQWNIINSIILSTKK